MAQRATTAQTSQLAQGAQGGSDVRVPSNRAEFEALVALRSELGSQVGTTTRLRQELTNQIAQAAAVGDNASISRFQARVRSLDARGTNLEQRLLQIDDAISTAVARGIVTEPPRTEAGAATSEGIPTIAPVVAFPPMFENPNAKFTEEVLASVVLGMTLLFTFVGLWIHRRAWRRAEKKFAGAGTGSGDLQQLQQAVDVIAVEVERIAEGQRYVSRLLNERLDTPGLGDGRERVPVPLQDDAAAARRR